MSRGRLSENKSLIFRLNLKSLNEFSIKETDTQKHIKHIKNKHLHQKSSQKQKVCILISYWENIKIFGL